MAHASPPSPPSAVRIEWKWKANADPWHGSSNRDEWKSYSDVETRIIEEAYQQKKSEAVLDDYHIVFKPHTVQISNNNVNNQRPVKRGNRDKEETLREARFLPDPAPSLNPFLPKYTGVFFLEEFKKQLKFSPPLSDEQRTVLVEKAAQGILFEGKKLGKQKEAQWMAGELMKVKRGSKEEIYAVCARLYTMESFLYKNMNASMRLATDEAHKELWMSKIPTYGPFAYILSYWRNVDPEKQKGIVVFRGANLSDEQIKLYEEMWTKGKSVDFPAFTSASRNVSKAEQFGNVLFVMYIRELEGTDMAPYSDYPEEETLINTDFSFTVEKCEFERKRNKWVICLKDMFL